MAQRSSIALFLATAGLVSGTGALTSQVEALDGRPLAEFAQGRAAQLAQATDCVPIGEGENCENPSMRRKPAATTTSPTAAPVRLDDAIKQEEQQLEQGDL